MLLVSGGVEAPAPPAVGSIPAAAAHIASAPSAPPPPLLAERAANLAEPGPSLLALPGATGEPAEPRPSAEGPSDEPPGRYGRFAAAEMAAAPFGEACPLLLPGAWGGRAAADAAGPSPTAPELRRPCSLPLRRTGAPPLGLASSIMAPHGDGGGCGGADPASGCSPRAQSDPSGSRCSPQPPSPWPVLPRLSRCRAGCCCGGGAAPASAPVDPEAAPSPARLPRRLWLGVVAPPARGDVPGPGPRSPDVVAAGCPLPAAAPVASPSGLLELLPAGLSLRVALPPASLDGPSLPPVERPAAVGLFGVAAATRASPSSLSCSI